MAKKEVKTDLWVAAQLDECKIHFDAQGSDVKEINEALKTASKREPAMQGIPNIRLSSVILSSSLRIKPTWISKLN